MLKNILNSADVKVLSKSEKIKIDGGGIILDPYNVNSCRVSYDCSINLNGKCICENGRCVHGPRYCQ
ncbi:hypothetical protein [Aquimarina sp. RZ0]|uniref:hypothetical protein n=1 Tax=Aquimarina sp. RZ0 TaxID=2607730 RepID=UPI0011F3C12B|nr:hypothetical protein [Aquimarina sp. RZ0]KAA1246142.1 hypothetical protein F0000_09170 [Aquimarina sp. RZ0]